MKIGEAVPKALGDAEVVGADGATMRLASLWSKAPVMLVFLRHFGCVGCSEQLGELVPRLEEITRAGVAVVLIGNGTPDQRDAFAERHDVRGRALLVTDPNRAAYRALALARSRWATFGPRSIVDLFRAMSHGHAHRGVLGDSTQLGGVALVDARGVVRFFHASRSIADHPSASDLVDASLRLALETSRPKAYV